MENLFDLIYEQAQAELGQDRLLDGDSPEDYINSLTNWQLVQMISCVLGRTKCEPYS